jgi:hypothetical protein
MAQPNQIFKTSAAITTVKGRKVANCTASDFSYRTGKQNIPMSDGLAISKGFGIAEISISTVETVDGISSKDIIALVINQEIITISFTQGGVTFVIAGTFDEMSKKTMIERGTTEGSYRFSGVLSQF